MTSRGNNGKPAISLNVEQFIQDIECRPAIWNRNYHCNKQFLELTWYELSKLYNLPCQTLKAKWKGLRDNFRVEYKRIPRDENGEMMITPEQYESKWAHYKALLYLVEHMRHRTNKAEQAEAKFYVDSFVNDNEECVVEPDLAHGLVHNDYTSDGQNDDDDDDKCITIDENNSLPSTIKHQQQNSGHQNHNNENNGMHPLKRKRQNISDNDSGIVLDIIKTEPADCNELRKSLNINTNITNSNNNSVSKLKFRQIRPNFHHSQQHQQQQQQQIDLIDQRNNLSNITSGNKNVDSSQIEKPTTMIATSSTARKLSMCSDREDDDYHYLMSLHPYMNKLQPSQKLRVRTKIQKLILKELYKEDLD